MARVAAGVGTGVGGRIEGGVATRVGDGCVYSLQFNTYLRELSLGLGSSDPGDGPDETGSDESSADESGADESSPDESGLEEYLSGRQRLTSRSGLENAAFATLAQDVALYQVAVARGHSPPDEEAMSVMGTNRERIRDLRTLLELHTLARESNLQGFRGLIESPRVRQLITVQGEEHLLALFEEAAKVDLSGASGGMEIHSALVESVGEDPYWTEVFFEQARWLVAIESFRLAVEEEDLDSSLPSGLRWQNLRERTWGSTVIELTDAAPEAVTLTGLRLYMNGLHALERDLLTK